MALLGDVLTTVGIGFERQLQAPQDVNGSETLLASRPQPRRAADPCTTVILRTFSDRMPADCTNTESEPNSDPLRGDGDADKTWTTKR
jgi:hypothetical protein